MKTISLHHGKKIFAGELYRKLEDEHEHLTSDEYLKMIWKENNVKFNHHGYIEG